MIQDAIFVMFISILFCYSGIRVFQSLSAENRTNASHVFNFLHLILFTASSGLMIIILLSYLIAIVK